MPARLPKEFERRTGCPAPRPFSTFMHRRDDLEVYRNISAISLIARLPGTPISALAGGEQIRSRRCAGLVAPVKRRSSRGGLADAVGISCHVQPRLPFTSSPNIPATAVGKLPVIARGNDFRCPSEGFGNNLVGVRFGCAFGPFRPWRHCPIVR